jgi:methylmalonyl-CoA/ethylmalonyl-CoA epimerase
MNAAETGIQISKLGQVSVRVHDLDRATAFYRDILGLTMLFTTGTLTFFDCAGVRLMLSRPEKTEFDHPGSILYFVVPDIRKAHNHMRESGARIETEPRLVARMPSHDLWMFGFHDSEDNLLELMSEVPRTSF